MKLSRHRTFTAIATDAATDTDTDTASATSPPPLSTSTPRLPLLSALSAPSPLSASTTMASARQNGTLDSAAATAGQGSSSCAAASGGAQAMTMRTCPPEQSARTRPPAACYTQSCASLVTHLIVHRADFSKVIDHRYAMNTDV
eukprot:6181797-Pleurochrysis_carterae.AAC.3